MLETKEQKQIFAGSIILVIILGLVSVWHRPDFTFREQPPLSTKSKVDYSAYLTALKVDEKASQKLLQQVVSPEDVRKQVEADFNASQKITPLTLDNIKIKQNNKTGKAAVSDYFQVAGGVIVDYSNQLPKSTPNLFGSGVNQEQLQAAQRKNDDFLRQLYVVEAPKEALTLHKSLLKVYTAYGEVLDLAKTYAVDSGGKPWPKLYNNYMVVNSSLRDANTEAVKLATKYDIALLPVGTPLAEAEHYSFVKTARAIPVIVVGNLLQAVTDALKQSFATAFANYSTQFLNNLVSSIENNYKISNFLYYTDALVSGQYVDDYLNKYVNSALDRAMVKNFIPQVSCNQNKDIQKILQAKADQYLGFDPATLSANDPEFYQKLARVGDFYSSSQGWQRYYQDVAAQAQSEAEKAADRELTSSGLKTPRDALGVQIAQSLESIRGSMQAALSATLNLGVSNAENIVSQIVSNVTYNLFNKFVFKGAVVYKEQSTCVPVPVISPVIPSAAAAYQTQPVNPQQIINQECSKLPRGCDSSGSPNP